MPRIARVYSIDYPHHITQRGNNRQPVFFDDEDREFYLKTLGRYSQHWGFDVWAYCLMTNHAHILLVPRKEQSLARGIGGTNLVYTQYINRKYKRSGRLWQNRFFSAIVDEEVYLWAVVRYIECNPVRAGLVQRAEDYRWSSCNAHVSGFTDSILSKRGWLDEVNIQAYKEFLRSADRDIEGSIRKATTTGRPLGSISFIQRLEKKLGRTLLPNKAGRPKKKEAK